MYGLAAASFALVVCAASLEQIFDRDIQVFSSPKLGCSETDATIACKAATGKSGCTFRNYPVFLNVFGSSCWRIPVPSKRVAGDPPFTGQRLAQGPRSSDDSTNYADHISATKESERIENEEEAKSVTEMSDETLNFRIKRALKTDRSTSSSTSPAMIRHCPRAKKQCDRVRRKKIFNFSARFKQIRCDPEDQLCNLIKF